MRPILLLPVKSVNQTLRFGILATLFHLLFSPQTNAQIYSYTNASSGSPASVAMNVTGSPLTRGGDVFGTSLACSGATEGFGSTGWPATNTFDVGMFNGTGDYITFTLTPLGGYGLNITGFTARSRRENVTGTINDGPIGMRYGYSTDGGMSWTTVNPGNPQSSNVCASSGVERIWPSFVPFLSTTPVIFRIYGLSSGTSGTGDFVLHNVVVSGTVCASAPAISPAPDYFLACKEAASVTHSYTTASADTYMVDYDLDAEAAGFVDVPSTALPVAPNQISFAIPSGAAPAVYYGTLVLGNSCGFSTEYDFSIDLRALPTIALSGDQTICLGDYAGLTMELTGSGPWNIRLSDGSEYTAVSGTTLGGLQPTSITTYTVTGLSDAYCEASPAGLTGSATVTVNPLPLASISADDYTICENGSFVVTFNESHYPQGTAFTVTATVDDDSGPRPVAFSNVVNGDNLTWTDGIDFSGTLDVYDVQVVVEGVPACATTITGFTVEVSPLPAAMVTISPTTICPGSSITFTLNETNYPAGTFDLFTQVTGTSGTGPQLFSGVENGVFATWTEGDADFSGDISFGTFTVTETSTGCQSTAVGTAIDVLPAPIFEFSASSDSDPGGAVDNSNGPASISIDFCVGDNLVLGGYSGSPAGIGLINEFTSTGNVACCSGTVFPTTFGPEYVMGSPSNIATFLGEVHGGASGYYLTSGNYGHITQVFTPYVDINGNDTYDSEIDCLGDPITLNYNVYAPINLSVTRLNTPDICSGTALDYLVAAGSGADVVVDLVVDELTGPGPNNPADLTDETPSIPYTTSVTLNASNGYAFHFTDIINNEHGSFDRGRIQVRATNIHYADATVCPVADVVGAATRVYPKPVLEAVPDFGICTGNTAQMDITLAAASLPSQNNAQAGYPVRIEWTVSAPGISGASNGQINIYNNTGSPLQLYDIAQTLTLVNPANGPQTATYTITPRSGGPTNAFNADDCIGAPITVVVTVSPPTTPSITGPATVHAGAQIQLTGIDNLIPPVSAVSAVWSTNSMSVTVDQTGIVTASPMAPLGPVTIFYTVSDNVGCTATGSYVVTVLGPLTLTSSVVGSSTVACGNEVTVEVRVSNFTDINSMDFSVNWDPTKFAFVSATPESIEGDLPTMVTSGTPMGQLAFLWADGMDPFSSNLMDGSLVLTYKLQAIGIAGMHNLLIADLPQPRDAYNGFFSQVPVASSGVTISITPITLTLGADPAICPSEQTAALTFSNVVGAPDHFLIDFGAAAEAAGFPDTYSGALNGSPITIPIPSGLAHGSYTATLTVDNTINGCTSAVYTFNMVVDQTPPTATSPAPIAQSCFPVPAPNPALVIDEQDNCPGPLTVTWENDVVVSGTGCGNSPQIITRSYRVTDVAGNTAIVTQSITIQDNVAPTVSTTGLAAWYPDEATAVAAAIALANATKDDNCTLPPDITVVQGTATSYSGCTATIHLIVSDECGNAASVSYTTVIDGAAPTVVAGNIDDCYEPSTDVMNPYYPYQYAVEAAIAATQMSDDCTAPGDLVVSASFSGDKCNLTIQIKAVDGCQKPGIALYHTRVEGAGPVISTSPDAISIDHGFCFDTPQDALDAALLATVAGDDCTAPEDLLFYAYSSEGCPATVTVEVTDYCGNVSSIVYTNVYIDGGAPDILIDEGYPTCFKSEAEAIETLLIACNPTDDCTSVEDLLTDADASFIPNDPDANCLIGTVHIVFTDLCGHSTPVDFQDIIIDDLPPFLVSFPVVDAQYACIDEAPAPDEQGVVATDLCSESVAVTWIEDVPPTSCPGMLTRTYRITDNCGNSTDVVQTISINDQTAPTWITTAGNLDRSFVCGDPDFVVAFNLEPVAEDNCGEVTYIKQAGEFVPSQTCPQEGTYTNTWVAYDQCSNPSATSFVQVISIVDNEFPEVVFGCHFMPSFLFASDGAECPANANISLEVGETINATQTWMVAGVEVANLENCVSDNCSPVEQITATLVDVEYTSDELYPDCAKTIVASFQIKDACGNANPDLFVCEYVVVDDVAPVWETPANTPFPNGLDIAISCTDVQSYEYFNSLAPTATDNCSGNVTVVKTQGVFVPGPDCAGEGTVTNTFVAYDACGENNPSAEFVQVIQLIDNQPPVFTPNCPLSFDLHTEAENADCPINATMSLEEGQVIYYQDGFTVAGVWVNPFGTCLSDNCNDPSTIKIHVIAVGTQYDAQACSRTFNIIFQLEDACGNIQPHLVGCAYHVIDNTPPSIFCGLMRGLGPVLPQACYGSVAEAEAAALEMFSGPGYGCDNCSGQGDLQWHVSTIGTCQAQVSVYVTDCAGNASLPYIFNTRIDNAPPTMVKGNLATCFFDAGQAEAAAYNATAISDDCDAIGMLDIVVSVDGTCPATITVTATDQCGNGNSVVYNNICIGSGSSVQITTEASNQNVDCTNETSGLAAWLSNHGGAIATGTGIVWSNTPAVFGPVNCMTHSKSATVTFTATDQCGYQDATTATFTVTDNTPPTANVISTTNMSCNANIPAPNTSLVTGAHDNCDASLTIALFSNSSNGGAGCPNSPLTILRTYSVTDDYCNTTYVTHTINIVDNVPPSFTAPGNITINVNNACAYNSSPAVTGDVTNESDNCSSGLNATYTDVTAPGVNTPDKYIITRTWHLTDNCGNSAPNLTQIIKVQDVTPPTLTCPNPVVMPGGVVENNSCAWVGTGLTPAFDDNCDGEVLTYTLSGTYLGSSTGTGSANGRIFLEGETTVTYTVTDAVGNSTSCSFLVTINCVTISGRIIWEHNHSLGVKDATVRLSQGATIFGSTLSDLAGNYTLSANIPGAYTITPVKNINRMNGVTSADVTIIQQHLANTTLITDPYKKIAADINRSGTITTQDASLLSQCLAGNPSALNIFNVFWRFVPTSVTLPATPPSAVPTFDEFINVTVSGPDLVGKDFYGVKLGDLNGSGFPNLTPNGNPLVWVLNDQTLHAGTEIEVNFAATGFDGLASYQFALDFDPTQLQFIALQSTGATAMTADNFGMFNANLGALRVVWSQAQGLTLADGTPVLKAKFKVLHGGLKLSDVLQLDNSELPGKAFTEALIPSDVRLVYASSVATSNPEKGNAQLQLFQNQPNPFVGETVIGFILPEACDAQLRIMDVSGRELTTYNRTYTAGYHEIEFKMENAASYGVLYYELVTPYGRLTKKMITGAK